MVITAPEDPRAEHPSSWPSLPPPPPHQYPLLISTSAFRDVPSTFFIGLTSTCPLVSHPDVCAHLRLLGAFHALEHSVNTSPRGPVGFGKPSGAVGLRIFIHQSVWRFELWLKNFIKIHGVSSRQLRDEEIPPLDVLLVWHAYLLNPLVYADDTTRMHPELGAVGGIPLQRIAVQINPTTYELEPTPAQVTFWELMTLTKYQPLSPSDLIHDALIVNCPRCAGAPLRVPWLSKPELDVNGHARGKGWCQNQFSVNCPGCRSVKEVIAVGRFAADIAQAMVDKRAVLPGTLFDPITGTLSPARAQLVTTLLLQPFVDLPPTQRDIGQHLGWSFRGIQKNISEAREILANVVAARKYPDSRQNSKTGLPTHAGRGELRTRMIVAHSGIGSDVDGIWRSFGPRIAKMTASYQDNPTSLSLDLVGAVLRQANFTSKAYTLGWLDSPDPQQLPLAPCITRYHNFLYLLTSFPARYLVPSLDIDLCWHTHQLSSTYMPDMKRFVGRYVDHDDKVEEGMLSNAFDTTSLLWEKTFQTSYSSWQHPPQAASKPLTRFLKIARSLASSSEPSKSTSTSPPDPRTYPSEHSSIVVIRDDRIARSRAKREEQQFKRRCLAENVDGRPFTRKVDSAVAAITFGELGLNGWALLGDIDHGILDAKIVNGQCCAGYNMPYYAGPVWGGNGSLDKSEGRSGTS